MRSKIAIFIAFALIFCGHALSSEYRDKGYLYLSPVPGAEYVSPQTKFFLVRFEAVSPYDLTNLSTFITVAGEVSGPHTGQTKIASDDRTVIFDVSSSFSNDELVTVTLTPTVDPCAPAVVEPYQYQFMVSGPMPSPPQAPASTLLQAPSGGSAAREQVMNRQATPDTECEALPTSDMAMMAEEAVSAAAADGPMIMPNGVSVPSDFPHVDIAVSDNPAPGYIFIDYSGGSTKYAMILDNSGAPVWYKQGSTARDFKIQKNGIITWANFSGYDQNFNYLRSFQAVNGYSTDDHELQVLENGGYLLFGRRTETVDMSRYVVGGKVDATVRETVLQEFTAAGELILQWRAWDNYDIRLMEYWSYDDKPTSQSIRFVHMNSVDVDTDGHLLVSSKRVSEVTKIHRYTGEVIWRLGSGHPTDPSQDPYLDQRLTILNDPLGQFDVQHDIRVVGENRYTVFDNHWLDRLPNSRAVEYEVDPNEMTATMVWQYQENPPYESYHMGNAQRLPNGNTLINWVITNAPKVTEVRPDGTKAFEMNWAARNSKSYRVFRFPWEGVVEVPYLIAESYPDNITLLFNKFGDPNVAYYRIYGGTTPQPTTLLDTSTSTLKRLSAGLENGRRYYFRVTAVNNHGTESDYSNEVNAVVSFTEPGQNMVLNGDFFLGKAWWTSEVGGSASAQWMIEAGVSHFDITNGGIQLSDVQLRQAGMQLIQGEEYVLEFDAWSDQPRYIEPKVGQDSSDYSKIGPRQITPIRTPYRYSFIMQDPSDYEASVMFNIGLYSFDVYLDNVSLRMNTTGASEQVTIVLVSHCEVPGVNPAVNHGDDELIAWLQSPGFRVDMICMNDSCKDDSNPFGNPAIVSALENADLVLVSRRTNSGDYDGNTEYWNTLATPMVLCSGYLTRSTRWNWTPCESSDANPSSSTDMMIEAGQENHPFLERLTGPVPLFDWSTAPTPGVWPKTVYLPNCDFVAGGTVIGRYGDTDQQPMLGDIPAGTTLANGNIAGERRVFFGHWSYDTDLGAPFNREANWDDFVTDNYKTILRNIINEVLGLTPGDFDFDGCVQLDDLAVLAGEWLKEQSWLTADLDDNGKIDFNDFAIFAENWTGASCP